MKRRLLLVAIGAGLSGVSGFAGAQSQPPTPARPAASIISAALKQAQAEDKAAFVKFGASWCAPCLRLDQFLAAPQVTPVIAKHFVIAPLTVWERGSDGIKNNPGADELIKKWGGVAIPFYAVLRPTGEPAYSSVDIGFPDGNESIDTFLDVLAKGAPRWSASDRNVLAEFLMMRSPDMGWRPTALRRLWSDGDFLYRSALSKDGHFVVSTNFQEETILHDLDRNTDRPIALPGGAAGKDQDGAVADQAAWSRDGRALAVSWSDNTSRRHDLRVIPVDTGVLPAKPLYADPEMEWIRPHDWTADGKQILVQIGRKDVAEIGLVSVADGSLKVLKRVRPDQLSQNANWTGRGDTNMMVSPDGRYVAFDLFRVADRQERDIYVIRLDTGQQYEAVVHASDDGVVGWSPSGRELFFVSDRTGEFGLWVAPFDQGKIGTPALVREGVGEITPYGTTPNGSLIYAPAWRRFTNIWSVGFDFATGERLSTPRAFIEDRVGRNSRPVFSPDGRTLAYASSSGGRFLIVTKKLADGAVREFPVEVAPAGLLWSPDGTELVVMLGTNGEPSIQRIDTRTGRRAPFVHDVGVMRAWLPDGRILFDRRVTGAGLEQQLSVMELNLATDQQREIFRGRQGGAARLAVSPDGRWLYYRRPVSAATPPHDLVARDLRTGEERLLVSQRPLGALFLSPDGSLIVSATNDPVSRVRQMLIVPTTGGAEPRVIRVDDGPTVDLVLFGPDSKSLLASRRVKGRLEFWWVPLDGRAAKLVDLGVDSLRSPSVSLDGRTIVFQPNEDLPPPGVWIMEFERRAGGS